MDNGKCCGICGKLCRLGEGRMIEGDGIVNVRREVLVGEVRACNKCAEEILEHRAQAVLMFEDSVFNKTTP
jgi:hypothetical protein